MQKNTKEEASVRHKGELLSLDLSDSDDNDDDDDETGAKDNTCYGNGNSAGYVRGVSTGAGEGSTKCIWFLSLSVLS